MSAFKIGILTMALGLFQGPGTCAIVSMEGRRQRVKVMVLPALLQIVALLCAAAYLAAQEVLVPQGALWRYSDTGVTPGDGWQAVSFDDATWNAGPAILGYGDGDVTTVIRYGPASTNKFITTYFRHAFVVSNAATFDRLRVRLLRDDGAVVYLNGTEVLRDNLPAGTITNTTVALTAVGGAEERAYFSFTVSAAYLVEGTNVLAVEVHQSSPTSSDVAFDLALTAEWPPFVITPLVTGDPVGGTNGTIDLAVTVSDPALRSSNVTVQFHLRLAGPAPGPDFTLVVLPDTQYYTAGLNGGTPAMFAAQTDWIVSNRVARNIAFVSQLGDTVEHGDNGGTNVEWLAAADALYRLEDPFATSLIDGIPYGVAVGNHDQTPNGSAEGTTYFYNQLFGIDHFAARSYYGGHFGTNNDTHYELFASGGLRFVALHLEYNAETNLAVLEWAGQILQTHADRRAIVVGHQMVDTGNPGSFGPAGQRIYDALKGRTNLLLMLGGHVTGEGRRTDVFQGRPVHTLLANYQSRENGGNGWLRLLEFSPSNSVIRVRTYSPLLDQYESDADSEFTLDCNLGTGGAFASVGETSAVIPTPSAGVTCSNLASATTYEWFVSVADGSRVQRSPVWRFTTGDIGESVLKLSIATTPNGDLEFSWPSTIGRIYRVCFKDDLETSGWTDLSEDIEAISGITRWRAPMPTGIPHRFYAVRVVGQSPIRPGQ
jgi:hypothetical protein